MSAIERRLSRLEREILPPAPTGRWLRVIIDRTEDGRRVATYRGNTVEQRHGESDVDFEVRYRLDSCIPPEDRIIVRRIIN